MGAMHMSLLGPEGLEHPATRNMTACIWQSKSYLKFPVSHYLTLPHLISTNLSSSCQRCGRLLAVPRQRRIIGGFDLSMWYPNHNNWLLVSVTDQTKAAEIELLAAHIAMWCAVGEVTV